MNRIRHVITRSVPRSLLRCVRMIVSPYILPGSYKGRLVRYERTERGRFSSNRESDLALLRMYSHVVDKGLNRPDWMPGHGHASYMMAKGLLEKHALTDDPSVVWARQIIGEYEKRQMACCGSTPHLGMLVYPPPIKPDDLLRQMRYRISSRSYEDRRVGIGSIERIVEAALEAPWSCSRQALRVYASVNPDVACSVAHCFRGFSSFGSFVPCIMVFCVDLRPYSIPAELFVPHLDVGLACANAALMASSLGLAMVFLSWGSRTVDDERRLRTQFAIPDHYEIVVGACCGYPDRNPVRPARKKVADTLVWR